MKTLLLSCFVIIACTITTFAEQITGTIIETGHGTFRLDQEEGLKSLYHESLRGTARIPEYWRPTVGDVVSVDYYFSREKNVVKTVELIKASPTTFGAENPVVGRVIEVGKSRYLIGFEQYGDTTRRFVVTRRTKYIPDDWKPEAGDKVKIWFHVKNKKYTPGIDFFPDKMEKIEGE